MTKGTNLITRYGWLVVLTASLTFSAWSLFYVVKFYGHSVVLAAVASAVFDGLALISANYSVEYSRNGESGFGPRLAVFVASGLSALFNSLHAVILHNPPIARLLWAAPPIAAVIAYDFHTKWVRRRALANAGRVAAPLPTFGRWAWLLFPVQTLKHVRAIVRYRGDVLRVTYAPGTYDVTPQTLPNTPLTYGETPRMLPPGPGETTRELHGKARIWARQQGFTVSHRGPLPADMVSRYLTARSAPTSPAVTPADTPETPDETTGFSLRAVRIPNETKAPGPVNGFDPANTRSEEIS